MSYKITCRGCGKRHMTTFLRRDDFPVVGEFLKKEDVGNETLMGLDLAFCEICKLVQCRQVPNAKELFTNYFYKSSNIKTLKNHFKNLANIILGMDPDSVLEIGGNDGILCNELAKYMAPVINVDPSDVAEEVEWRHYDLYNTFFTEAIAKKIQCKDIEVITTSNCFAHINDLDDVLRGVKFMLAKKGTFIIEVHWLGALLKNNQFPFIYHEHMSYFSLVSLQNLMHRHGLYINKVEDIEIHGGSKRYYINKYPDTDVSILLLKQTEHRLKINELETLQSFSANIDRLKEKNLELLRKYKNKSIFGYGASGQANSLMAFFGITNQEIQAIFDDSPRKWGYFTPKNHIEILQPSVMKHGLQPDCIYVMAPTFLEEIKMRNQHYSGDWICPILE